MNKNLIKREEYSINTPYKAKQMANALANHIKINNLSVNIAGHEYVQVEGWQFAGGLMGLFPQITEVKELAPMKWMARAEIKDRKTDKVVSVGYAVCSKEEAKKKTFDEYAILSMAQTRAIGKAFRNYIGWIIKMAGYNTMPAEEAKNIVGQPVVGPEPAVKEEKQKDSLQKLIKEVWTAMGKPTTWTNKEVVDTINKRTGLKLTDLKLTETHAQRVLFAWLEAK